MKTGAEKKAAVKSVLTKFFADQHVSKPTITFNDGYWFDIKLSFSGCDDSINLMLDSDGYWELYFNCDRPLCVTVGMPMKLEALYKIHVAMGAICAGLADSTANGLNAVLNAAVA